MKPVKPFRYTLAPPSVACVEFVGPKRNRAASANKRRKLFLIKMTVHIMAGKITNTN